jgi:ornithine carbamoyltransferase
MTHRRPAFHRSFRRFGAADLRAILDDAMARKSRLKAGPSATKPLEGKVLAMIFEKPSTRTRVSFDVGMRQLGGETIMLTGTEMQLGRARRSPTPRGAVALCRRDHDPHH